MASIEMVRKHLEKRILSSGHTFREISLKIGRKDSYIQQYIKYGFPKRLKEIDRKKVCQVLGIEEKELIDDELLKSGIDETPMIKVEETTSNINDFAAIDIYEMRGLSGKNKRLIGRLAINQKDFYGWCDCHPTNIKIMRLSGDVMEPKIPNGSLIIYDSSLMEYTGDGLYIINYDGEITLKRLQKVSQDEYLMKSENPRYQDLRCSKDDIEIIGRAINCLCSKSL